MRILLLASTVLLGLIAAGCGGRGGNEATPSAPATQTPTASSRSPADGFASGQLTSVAGRTIIVQGQNALTRVALTGATTIVMQVAGSRRDLVKGACLVASGTRKGVGIAAEIVTVGAAGTSGCGADEGPEDTGANGAETTEQGQAHTSEGSQSQAFAAGTISAVEGTSLRLEGTENAATVVVSASTQIRRLRRVSPAAVTAGLCATVRGQADETGAITAASISLSRPRAGGCAVAAGDGDFGGDPGGEASTDAGG